MTDGPLRWSDGPWEDAYSYSRVVRVGPHVYVAGTTAAAMDGSIRFLGDAGGQAEAILERIGRALEHVGASLDDVVRTRIHVVAGVDPEPVLAAHARAFARARPAAALYVVAGLLTPGMLVEIEADGLVAS